MRISTWAFLLLPVLAVSCHGAKILALLTMASPSHYIWSRVLLLELAKRGHQVTVLSSDKEMGGGAAIANYTNLVVEGMYEGLGDEFDYIDMKHMGKVRTMLCMYDWGTYICERTLQSRAARHLLQMAETETFDLILAEVTMAECAYGFVNRFGNPPVVGVTAMAMPPWLPSLMGNPVNPAYVNAYDLPFSDRMGFIQRAANLLYYLYIVYSRDLLYVPKIDKISKEFFGDSVPTVAGFESKIAVTLVNSHFIVNHPQPYVPAIVPVGGLHMKPPQSLPKDLQSYLDESPNGVIYFNLGTNVKSSKLGPNVKKMLLDAFGELPQNVLWKFETEDLPDLPKNVKISKWFPQTDLLAHPNVRVFISHGGLLSTHEAIYRGVPVVIMPIFIDQDSNAAALKARGAALELDYLTMTKEDIVGTLKEIINNPSYRRTMKELSMIFRDQPETPLERAVYWTEYVLRNGGAPHMRSASLDLAWYQLYLLDVLGAALAMVVAAVLACYFVLKRVIRAVRGGEDKKKLKKQ